MKKLFPNSTLLVICAIIFSCCHKDKISAVAPIKSTEKNILSFTFIGLPKGEIDQTKKTIQFTVPTGTIVTGLKPVIQVSAKATVNPPSGQAQDFTNKVTYTVTAEDGSTQEYKVSVAVEGMLAPKEIAVPRNSASKILSFDFDALTPKVIGKVEETQVILKVPEGTDVRSLVPTIVISPKATITPSLGEAQDFSNHKTIIYTVTSEDGSSKGFYAVAVFIVPKFNFTITSISPFMAAQGSLVSIKGVNFNYNGYGNKKVILTDKQNPSVSTTISKFEKLTDNELAFKIPDNMEPATYSVSVSIDDQEQQVNSDITIISADPIIYSTDPSLFIRGEAFIIQGKFFDESGNVVTLEKNGQALKLELLSESSKGIKMKIQDVAGMHMEDNWTLTVTTTRGQVSKVVRVN